MQLAKRITSLLEDINSSGNTMAMTTALNCVRQLREFLSDYDLQNQQSSSGSPLLTESYAKAAEADRLLAQNMLGRLEHTRSYLQAGSTHKITFPKEIERAYARALNLRTQAQSSSLKKSTGKELMERIEKGIEQNLYSPLEAAWYNLVKRQLVEVLRELNNEDLIERGISSISEDNSTKITRALAYLSMLDVIVWKVDYKEAQAKLERITTENHPHTIHKPKPREPTTAELLEDINSKKECETCHPTPASVQSRSRNLDKFERLLEKQKKELFEGKKNAREEIILASKKASKYFEMLADFVENYVEGEQFHLSSEDTKTYIARFKELGKEAQRVAKELERSKIGTEEDIKKNLALIEKRWPYSKNDSLAFNRTWKLDAERQCLFDTAEYFTYYTDSFDSMSWKSDKEMESLLTLINTREKELILINDELPISTRTAAVFDIFVLNNAVEICVGSAAIGGIIGAAATKGTGFVPGAKLGWATGALIVAAAGAFNTGEALSDYIQATTPAAEERALADMRYSAFHIGFGIGGGPLRVFSPAAARIVSATAFGSLFAANSVLLVEDIQRAAKGDASAYTDIPMDVGFIIIGGMGFFKTMQGIWKPVSVPKHMSAKLEGKTLIAGSFGFTMEGIGVQLPKIIARTVRVGYSPGFVMLNSGFSILTSLPELEYEIKKGNYRQAFRTFSEEFTRMSSAMITFEFVLAGLGAGASRVIRKFPLKTATRVRFLQANGLHSRISELAAAGGAKLDTPKMQAKIIEIAFGSRGKFSAAEVQALLTLDGKAGIKAAEAISKDVSSSWALARAAFPTKGVASAKKLAGVWERAKNSMLAERARQLQAIRWLRTGGRAGSRLTVPVLIGVSSWSEYKSKKEIRLNKHLAKELNPIETDFINSLVSTTPEGRALLDSFKVSSFKHAQVLGAFEWISERDYPGANAKKVTAEKRLRVACALGLLMNGEAATSDSTEFLAESTRRALSAADITFDEKTSAETLALAAYLVNAQGAARFVENYKTNEDRFYEYGWIGSESDLFIYNVAGLYAAAALGESTAWAAERTFMLLDASAKYSPGQKEFIRGWPLLRALLESRKDPANLDDAIELMVISGTQSNALMLQGIVEQVAE